MPNPRNRHSRMRKRLRRSHDAAAIPQLAVCKTTGEVHQYHRAYKHDGALYYRGQVLVPAKLAPDAAVE
jgi:large subunit ribosomal protein L32